MDTLHDSLLAKVLSYMEEEGGELLQVALTCKRFDRILNESGRLPYERPSGYHPSGATLMLDVSREYLHPGATLMLVASREYRWSCCEGNVYNPGCINDHDSDYEAENDRVREEHLQSLEVATEDEIDDGYDSAEWCDDHCGCGYGDGVYAYCMNAGLYQNRGEFDYPRGGTTRYDDSDDSMGRNEDDSNQDISMGSAN